MIYSLIILLLLLLVIGFWINNKDYLSPIFVFISAFFVSAFDCALNLSRWKTEISIDTVLVIFCGVFSFFIATIFASEICRKFSVKRESKIYINENYNVKSGIKSIECSKIFLLFFICLQIITGVLILREIDSLTAPYRNGDNIASAIGMYQYLDKFTTLDLRFSSYLVYLFLFVSTSGYIWGYIASFNYIFFKKINIYILLNFILSCVLSMFTGSRGNALQMFVSVLIIFMILQRIKNKSKKHEIKNMLMLIFAMCILLISFETFAGLMGRDNSLNLFDYISVYLGAPIKNLDLYISQKAAKTVPWGGETFLTQINWINGKLGLPVKAINVEMTYLQGINLGNVYTAFKAYYADFGYSGVISCNFVMGFIIQFYYESIKRKRIISFNKNSIHISILIYAHLFFAMAFSFFSNKFYESFTITFLEKIFFCWLLAKIICRKQNNY